MRQRRLARAVVLQQRRAEAEETEIAFVGGGRGQAAKACAIEKLFRIGRQIAGERRGLSVAVEHLAIGGLARRGRSEDRGQLIAAPRDQRLTSGAHGRKRHHVDLGPGLFGPRGGAAHGAPQHGLEAIVADMMQMIGFGGGEQDAVDPRPEQA